MYPPGVRPTNWDLPDQYRCGQYYRDVPLPYESPLEPASSERAPGSLLGCPECGSTARLELAPGRYDCMQSTEYGGSERGSETCGTVYEDLPRASESPLPAE